MESKTWKKLNLKNEKLKAVLNAPESFESEIQELSGVEVVGELVSISGLRFLIAFVTQRQEIEKIARKLADLSEGDVTVWFSYPKGSSKRYSCDINRDSGWQPLGAAGFEGVRQVAIDEDWSAIRFRRVEYVKKMKRDSKRTLTAEGEAKATKK